MRILIAFIFLFTQTTWGQTTGKNIEFNSVTGADYFTNYVIQPSAKKNAASTTTSSASVSKDTTNKIDNVASYSVDASAQNGYVEFTLGTVYDPATSGNCEFKGVFKGDGTLYKAQIVDGSGNLLNQTSVLTNETNWRTFSVTYPCAASGSRKVRITQTESGTAPAFSVGKLYYGQITNLQAGVPNNVFVANISSASVVSNENEDFISGNCSQTTGTDNDSYTCPLKSGKFTVAPICNVDADASPGTGTNTRNCFVSSSSTSQVIISCTDQGAPFAVATKLTCNRAGTDFIQPAITADQWDFDWRDGAGYGESLDNATLSVKEMRKGSNLHVVAKITYSGAATAGQNISITIPYTPDVTKMEQNGGGSICLEGSSDYLDVGLGSYYGFRSCYNSGSTISMYSQGQGTGNTLIANSIATTSNLPTVPGSADTIIMRFTIPIQGWTENQNAPILVGSVTSNASGALRIESLYVSASCTATPCATSPTIGTQGWFSSVSRNSTGNYTVNIKSGVFSIAPICFGNANTGGSGSDSTVALDTASTTSQIVYTRNAGTFTDLTFFLTCIGPR